MAQVNFRIDDRVKNEADELFDNLGLSLSAAITIFLKQAVARRGFPFPIVEPTRGTSFEYPPMEGFVAPRENDARMKRRTALRALAGSWQDDRKTSEIIREIEGARTHGRTVDL